MEYLTTRQAAATLRLSIARVCQLLAAGRIPGARKFGPVWQIPPEGLAEFAALDRKPGRPVATEEESHD